MQWPGRSRYRESEGPTARRVIDALTLLFLKRLIITDGVKFWSDDDGRYVEDRHPGTAVLGSCKVLADPIEVGVRAVDRWWIDY